MGGWYSLELDVHDRGAAIMSASRSLTRRVPKSKKPASHRLLADDTGHAIRLPANVQAALVVIVAPNAELVYAQAQGGDFRLITETLARHGWIA